ncbi:hypothetical protein HYN59_08915 [Flavobacterium album]|uniref:Uncharacterized protein n=1 Tax=Flavobacterium album TaxID=2175091 RepID=A0A2S1QYA6_9FLAO|nr:hypothetical protein HYN59_08915 [Flavobacterium album]
MLAGCYGYGSGDDVVLTDPPPASYQAVVMDRGEFEAAVHMMPVQPITKAGKIYIKDNFLFINDVNKGFHVFNYTDPLNPMPLGFLNIPGATDLAMSDNVMYVNQATDLVTMQFQDVGNTVIVTKRNKDVFPVLLSPNGTVGQVADNEVVIGWDEI